MRWPSPPLLGTAAILGIILGLLFLPPFFSLGTSGVARGLPAIQSIGASYLWTLVFKTISLACLTTVWAMILAVPFAWLVVRTDVPGRHLWRWLGSVPLAIPSYIGALTYITLLGPAGVANDLFSQFTGHLTQWTNIYGYWGGVFVLGLFTYPLIFLFVTSALENTNPSLEEAARSLGQSPLGVLRHVTLPLLRPMMFAGGLLVFLYAISDFGALSLLRVQVLTTEIYHQLNTRFDQAAAALLACLLVAIALMVLAGQRLLLGRRGYGMVTGQARTARLLPIGAWRWPALAWVLTVLTGSFFLPVGVLFYQAGMGTRMADVLQAQWSSVANSVGIGAVTAMLAVVLGMSVAYTSSRVGRWIGRPLSSIAQIGYAIPGTVLGLSVILLYNTYVPWLYGSVAVIVIAYLIRFLTQTVQGSEAALAGMHRHIEEAARGLGARAPAVLRRIIIPITKPALFAGWALVFISSMKELDATLLLRPAGFDTIPVRIYIHTVEAEYATAATMALLLICATAIPWLLITKMRARAEIV